MDDGLQKPTEDRNTPNEDFLSYVNGDFIPVSNWAQIRPSSHRRRANRQLVYVRANLKDKQMEKLMDA